MHLLVSMTERRKYEMRTCQFDSSEVECPCAALLGRSAARLRWLYLYESSISTVHKHKSNHAYECIAQLCDVTGLIRERSALGALPIVTLVAASWCELASVHRGCSPLSTRPDGHLAESWRLAVHAEMSCPTDSHEPASPSAKHSHIRPGKQKIEFGNIPRTMIHPNKTCSK